MNEIYNKLISEYLKRGGSQSFIDRLPPVYSLRNEAKLRFELSKLKPKSVSFAATQEKQTPVKRETSVEAKTNSRSLNDVGLISEYPPELHELYSERTSKFITACSLKMQLNEVVDYDIDTAYELQKRIIKCFNVVDKANEALNHYRKLKRVLPLKNTVDFSNLSQAEMIRQRNRLRSNISNRQRTVKKIQKELENAADKDKVRLSSKLTQKLEQLENFKLQVEELDRLIEQIKPL